MKVSQDGELYIIEDGVRWWTSTAGDPPYIVNEKLTPVNPDGRLGRQITAAVERFING